MDELTADFLVETKEGLEVLDNDLIELERNPDNKEIISNLFRVMHTIKGTCGFLGLSRLEKVAHAGEDVMDKVREGKIRATPEIVSIILKAVDHIKFLVGYLEEHGTEQAGDDSELVTQIKSYATGTQVKTAEPAPAPAPVVKEEPQIEEFTPEMQFNPEEEIVTTIATDSADLQALFDSTPSLINLTPPPENTTPVVAASDSDSLQALFDSTPSLVDLTPPTEATPSISGSAAPAVSTSDSDSLQALFDSTPSLVDMGPPPEKAASVATPTKVDDKKQADDKKNAPAQTIRVSIDVLEELMQHASELVLTRNQLLQLMRANEGSIFASSLQRLNNITTGLQEGVMKTRMQPVGNAWTKLPRIVRDLSIELHKKIDLKMEGEDTELDRQLLEMIGDPLTHMVRNSADHGIETPEKRLAAGKPETGTIKIRAYHGGGYIIIEITDDGNGINTEVIKQKAIEKGLVLESVAATMNKAQILQFIFVAGFSTAAAITSVSGRGVGMDVVKNNIEKISGTVELDSEVGKGSKFTIRIPLTLAIMPVLKLEIQGHKFAIPQINVREVVKTGKKSQFQLEVLDESPVLRLRGRLLPLVVLSETLGLQEEAITNEKNRFVIVCELGNYSFGVIVDKVHDTEEIVVKPVSPILKSISIYSGSTILGDGSVILLLDPNSLAKESGDATNAGQNSQELQKLDSDEAYNASFIVFKAGDATPKVAPLELISRLEEIDITEIEYSRGIPVVQYRGELMRLMKIDPNYELPKEGIQELLVVSDEKKYMGLVVEKILDIVKSPISKDISGGSNGFIGSIVINGITSDVVDLGYYFKETFRTDWATSADNNLVSCKRVLFVDDSPFFRKFIPPELEAAGFTVTTVSNGHDALEKLDDGTKYIAIITDLTMPGMSGSELVNICRQKPHLQDLPIVALSADRDGTILFENGEFVGIDAFVAKTSHGELVSTLTNVIKQKERTA